MASLGTIAFGTGSNFSNTAETGTPPVLEVIASASLTTHVHDTSNTTHTGTADYALGDMPSDFGHMDTLSVNVRYGWQSGTQTNTWNSLTVQIFQSDGSTALTASRTIASSITTNDTTSGALAFTGVDTTSDKTVWDGAIARISWSISKVKSGDSLEERVFAAELTGTYTVGASTTPKSVSDTVSLTETEVQQVGKPRSETVSLTETFVKQAQKVLADTVSFAENLTAIKLILQSVNDTISFTESMGLAVNKTVGDSVALTETFVKSLPRTMADTVSLAEARLLQTGKSFAETVSLGETFNATKVVLLSLDDTLGLTETFVRLPNKALGDAVAFTEAKLISVGRVLGDVLGLTETFTKVISTIRTDVLGLSENLATSTGGSGSGNPTRRMMMGVG
ncbi:MAG TPA: hypothetical protein DCG68_05560 [Cryomorphaceae bacterium]|nr:hypothetical protein [Cryomorphaceae bacterium]